MTAATKQLETARDAFLVSTLALKAAMEQARTAMEQANAAAGEDADWADLHSFTPAGGEIEDLLLTILDGSLEGPLVQAG